MRMEEVMAKAAEHGVDVDLRATYRRPKEHGPFKFPGGTVYRATAKILGDFGMVVVHHERAADTPQGAMEKLRDALIEASADFNNAALWLTAEESAS